MLRSIAAALLLCAPSARAANTLSFEAALGDLRRHVLAARAAQIQARSETLAQRIEALSSDTGRLAWDGSRLRDRLRDIRWRARRSRRGQPGRPGQQDPFLRNDIQRLVWDLRDLNRGEDAAAREAAQIFAAVQKDPALVGPAETLRSQAGRLESDLRWLESDARMASWDLRDAGFNMEAWDVERLSSDAERTARDLDSLTARIVERVR